MKKILLVMALLCCFPGVAQDKTETYKAKTATLDATVKALYEVISGPKGQERDWEFLRFMFHPEARFIASGQRKDGSFASRYVTMDDYIANSGKWMLENGFFEKELHRETDRFGQIAQVFSSYECFKSEDDTEPFMRGINSIQLMFTGERWVVMNIYFTQETENNPIPTNYLPKG